MSEMLRPTPLQWRTALEANSLPDATRVRIAPGFEPNTVLLEIFGRRIWFEEPRMYNGREVTVVQPHVCLALDPGGWEVAQPKAQPIDWDRINDHLRSIPPQFRL